MPQTNNEKDKPHRGGFLFGGTLYLPDDRGAVGCVPSDAEMRQQKEVAAARFRYQLEHPDQSTTSIASQGSPFEAKLLTNFIAEAA